MEEPQGAPPLGAGAEKPRNKKQYSEFQNEVWDHDQELKSVKWQFENCTVAACADFFKAKIAELEASVPVEERPKEVLELDRYYQSQPSTQASCKSKREEAVRVRDATKEVLEDNEQVVLDLDKGLREFDASVLKCAQDVAAARSAAAASSAGAQAPAQVDWQKLAKGVVGMSQEEARAEVARQDAERSAGILLHLERINLTAAAAQPSPMDVSDNDSGTKRAGDTEEALAEKPVKKLRTDGLGETVASVTAGAVSLAADSAAAPSSTRGQREPATSTIT